MKVTLVFSLFLVLMGAMLTNAESDCNCTDVYDPVCGRNGRTYGNDCQANCAGVEVEYKGRCDGGSTS